MQLTPLQKQIVDSIIHGRNCTIQQFFEQCCAFHAHDRKPEFSNDVYGERPVRDALSEKLFVVDDSNKAYDQIKEFVSVWHKLEASKLIIGIPSHKPTLIFPVYYTDDNEKSFKLDTRIVALFDKYDAREIVPHPELKEFLESDFNTREELLEKRQLLERKSADSRAERAEARALTSEKWTRTIALVSLFVSVVAIFLNFLTYRTDRSVTITNPNAFQDTTRVVLIPAKPTEIDTAKSPLTGIKKSTAKLR